MSISAVSSHQPSLTVLNSIDPVSKNASAQSSSGAATSTVAKSSDAAGATNTKQTSSTSSASSSSTSSASSSGSSRVDSGGEAGVGINASLDTLIGSYNFTVGTTHYSSSISESGGEYTASVSGMASVSASSEMAVENAVSLRISEMA